MAHQFGEIVLIRFPFTGGTGFRRRPALVLFDSGDNDVLVCRITSVEHSSLYDVFVNEWSEIGLLSASTIRVHKMATLEKNLIERIIGQLNEELKTTVKNTFLALMD